MVRINFKIACDETSRMATPSDVQSTSKALARIEKSRAQSKGKKITINEKAKILYDAAMEAYSSDDDSDCENERSSSKLYIAFKRYDKEKYANNRASMVQRNPDSCFAKYDEMAYEAKHRSPVDGAISTPAPVSQQRLKLHFKGLTQSAPLNNELPIPAPAPAPQRRLKITFKPQATAQPTRPKHPFRTHEEQKKLLTHLLTERTFYKPLLKFGTLEQQKSSLERILHKRIVKTKVPSKLKINIVPSKLKVNMVPSKLKINIREPSVEIKKEGMEDRVRYDA
jgi:hypothetical protein